MRSRGGQLDVRLASEARKAREQVTREIGLLREQGRKVTSQLKSTLGDASKRERLLKEAHARIADLRVELGRKTTALSRKSRELKQLAEESAHRAAAIIRGDAQQRTGTVEEEPPTAPPTPPGPGSTGDPSDRPIST